MFRCRFPRRPILRAALVLLLGLLLGPGGATTLAAPTGPGQPIKLSGDMPADADVDAVRIGPDDRYAVYFANPHAPDQRELYSVPVMGGVPVRLSPGTVSQVLAGYGAPSFSPDGGRVLFLDGFPGNLFIAPLTGPSSAAIQLNTPFPDGSKARDGYFSHDGARVMWVRMGGSYGQVGVYTVPSQGPASASVKLAETVPGGSVWSAFSADDSRIIYGASEGYPSYRSELYSVPAAGPASAAIKLNAPLVAGGYVGQFRLSADPQRVTYLASGLAPDLYELYSVSILGGPVTKLNVALEPGEKVEGNYLTCGNQVVYKVRGPSGSRLFRVPAAGPASDTVPVGCPTAAGVYLYPLRCQNDRLIYEAEASGAGTNLYSAPLSGPGGACTRLTPDLPSGSSVYRSWLDITPSGSHLTYFEFSWSLNPTGSVHAVPVDGPAAANITLSLGEMGSRDEYGTNEINRVGSRLLYSTVVGAAPRELYSVPVSGPAAASVKLNGPLVAGGSVSGMPHTLAYAARGRVALYIADAEVPGKDELFAVADVPGPETFLPMLLR